MHLLTSCPSEVLTHTHGRGDWGYTTMSLIIDFISDIWRERKFLMYKFLTKSLWSIVGMSFLQITNVQFQVMILTDRSSELATDR